jgi:hypothetical protein
MAKPEPTIDKVDRLTEVISLTLNLDGELIYVVRYSFLDPQNNNPLISYEDQFLAKLSDYPTGMPAVDIALTVLAALSDVKEPK